jgi:hypothetical protein
MADKVWQCALCEATSQGTMVRRSKSDRSICTWCEAELVRTGRIYCSYGRHAVDPADLRPHSRLRRCRACERQYRKIHRAAHREAINADKRERYHATPETAARRESRRAANRRYYHKHRARLLVRVRAWQLCHADELRAARRERYARNAERERASFRRRYQQRKLAVFWGAR